MGDIYLIIIIVLFLLAITNLVVGVSNDAVNFLVSAIGSRAGKFNLIMAMASIGILAGAVFSNGMMEVARKGIFHPELFYFSEVITIFLAVMITNVILLDFFNTFGFPTSTTVSLVFGLLGAAVGVALIKSANSNFQVTDYINTGQALTIIGGILLSVVVAFIFGTVIQWFARLIFSFNYEKSYKYFGAIWGGISLSVITFFMFIKGFKNSSFADTPTIHWIVDHQFLVLLISFVFWTILFQLLINFFKANILKFVVLMGTLALAMAFAGNDLVNFIGVPLAGFSSYTDWSSTTVPANEYLMTSLGNPVQTKPIFLIVSALIMIVTLWTSKKARSVTDTSVNLSRQNSGYERFGSTQVSRALVRWAVSTSQFFDKVIPRRTKIFIEKRFEMRKPEKNADLPAFDLIRASVTLVVASITIAIATSYKLPLSTTYVSFMVAMGTSLSDRAWGRESAVYRVTGVISVVSGWFITALVAFTMAFVIALIIYYGGNFAIGLLIATVIFLIYRTQLIHKQRVAKEKEEIKKLKNEEQLSDLDIFDASTAKVVAEMKNVEKFINKSFDAFVKQDRKDLKKVYKLGNEIKGNAKMLKKDIFNTVHKLKGKYLISAQYYVQIIDALREVSNAVSFLGEMLYDHIDNNHELFNKHQIKIIANLDKELLEYITECIVNVQELKFNLINDLRETRNNLLISIEETKKQELEIIQKDQTDIINSELFLNILSEYKNMSIYIIRIVKAHRKFYLSGKKAKKDTKAI